MSDFVYGVNPVSEALSGSLRPPIELYAARGHRSARLEQVIKAAQENGVPVRQRDRQDLDRMVGHAHHQGVVLKVEAFDYADFDDLLKRWRDSGAPGFFIALDGLTDPHNVGAIIRSAESAGCHGVITVRDRACPVTPVVDKAAAGALAHLPLCQVTNLSRTLDDLKKEGFWTFGLAGDEGSVPLYDAGLEGNLVLVVGSEGSGLRQNVRKHCDVLVGIPMHGEVSSLNASVAAAVAMFEVVRRRLKG